MTAARYLAKRSALRWRSANRHRYKVTAIAPRHFEQTAKLAGFPMAALREVMAEIVSDLRQATEALTAQCDERVPVAMTEAILAAANKRADQIETYLNG